MNNREQLTEKFIRFAKSFYSEDLLIHENIVIKENHTHRVCQFSQMICESLDVNESEKNTAYAVALLHDIGRFPQFTKYRTFSDYRSENHATLGISVIKEYDLLNGFNSDDKDIIICAVSNHNRIEIEKGLTARQLLHSKLIRDADKLDIIGLLLNYFSTKTQSPKPGLQISLHDTPGFSREIPERIIALKTVDNSMRKNQNDFKLALLSWLPDLNYDFSLQYVIEKGFIKHILSLLPKDEIIMLAADTVENEIKNRLAASVLKKCL